MDINKIELSLSSSIDSETAGANQSVIGTASNLRDEYIELNSELDSKYPNLNEVISHLEINLNQSQIEIIEGTQEDIKKFHNNIENSDFLSSKVKQEYLKFLGFLKGRTPKIIGFGLTIIATSIILSANYLIPKDLDFGDIKKPKPGTPKVIVSPLDYNNSIEASATQSLDNSNLIPVTSSIGLSFY